MKHKVKVQVPVEKRGLFGIKKTVMETRTIEVEPRQKKPGKLFGLFALAGMASELGSQKNPAISCW